MTRISGWKHALALSLGLLAVAAGSARAAEKPAPKPFADADHVIYSLAHGAIVPKAAGDVTYHGGPLIASANVVLIFWGPTFANPTSPDYTYAQSLQSFRNVLGTSSSWTMMAQYGIQSSDLGAGTPDWFDTSTPPTDVTDSSARAEINRYLASHAYDSSTIYEVVLPSTSYSSSGSSTSCGGPGLAYCAYHSSYSSPSGIALYQVLPYPSCSGCQISGWSTAQIEEHFLCFDARDTVTDPLFSGWYDKNGAEICQKCGWTTPPSPTSISHICGKAWSNDVHGCVY